MLYNLKEILQLSQKGKNAVAAFNVFGYEDAYAVVQAAEKLNKPVILMANRDAIAHMGAQIIGSIILQLAEKSTVPVCVHLDHSLTVEAVGDAIEAGFTSVMIDASQLPFEENVAVTRQVVEMARPKNVSVEAEIGSVGYSDSNMRTNAVFTDPEQAKQFAQVTGADAVAVAVGTVHRMVTQGVNLQFDRLDQISGLLEVPIVIHGSTGVSDDDLSRLVRHGAQKINLGTTLRMAFGNTLRKQVEENPKEFDRIRLFSKCMEAVQEKAEEKINLIS